MRPTFTFSYFLSKINNILDAASFITGQTLAVDGGRSVAAPCPEYMGPGK